MTPEQIAGIISAVYGLTVFDHCRKLWKSKQTQGTSAFSLVAGVSVCCAFSWTFWTAGLWWSFWGNNVIALSNAVWLAMVLYYGRPGKIPTLTVTINDGHGTEIVFPRVAKVDFELPAVHWPGLRPPPKSV